MGNKHVFGALCACLTMVSFNANSALVGRLASTPGGTDYQAYYDTEADLTWLADATGPLPTRSYFPAKSWAENLNVAGITGWRLPDANLSCEFKYNCAFSEMANLFYNALGNTAGSLTNTGPFTGVAINGYYWLDSRIKFDMVTGFHLGTGGLNVTDFVWAVHSGDVEPPSAVPVPAATWLFGSGLIGLIGLARRKKAYFIKVNQ